MEITPIDEVLQPQEINQFLQGTIVYDTSRHDDGNAVMTGCFITRLIQNSYNAGYNGFMINTELLTNPLSFLGDKLQGTSEDHLRLDIKGDLYNSPGFGSEYCHFKVGGNAGYFDLGWYARNSVFTLYGETKGLSPLVGGIQNVTLYVKDEGTLNEFLNLNCKEIRLYRLTPPGEELVYDYGS